MTTSDTTRLTNMLRAVANFRRDEADADATNVRAMLDAKNLRVIATSIEAMAGTAQAQRIADVIARCGLTRAYVAAINGKVPDNVDDFLQMIGMPEPKRAVGDLGAEFAQRLEAGDPVARMQGFQHRR